MDVTMKFSKEWHGFPPNFCSLFAQKVKKKRQFFDLGENWGIKNNQNENTCIVDFLRADGKKK